MSTAKINIGAKQLLAKLMAEENITVIHRQGASTAMFDSNKRVLVLPILNDMRGFTYNHFIGHEVGHALYSIPILSEGMDEAIKYIDNKHRNLVKNFLNVCEDVRIEKLILKKYPGLALDFRNSYKKLLDDNFFGTKGKDINSLPMADRVNLQTKLGSLVNIPFTEDEQKILDEIEAAYTWDQTVIATKKLYDYCSQMENEQQCNDSEGDGDSEESDSKNNKSKKSKDGQNNKDQEDYEDSGNIPEENDGNDSEEGEDDSEGDGEDSEDGKESDGNSDNEGKDKGKDGDGDGVDGKNSKDKGSKKSDTKKSEQSKSSDKTGNGASKHSKGNGREKVAPSCDTQQNFERNSSNLFDKNAKNIEYYTIPKAILPKMIVPYKKVIANITDYYKNINPSFAENGLKGYEAFRSESKTYIDYMVQQFNLKKAADDSQRATISKTGMIDVGQLYSYKFNEDLFKRTSILPGEKNHALVMFVDFSGSMSDHMKGTIEQALNAAMYCRKLNIPFELYSFGARGENRGYTSKNNWEAKNDDFSIPNFELRQYFGIGMSQSDFRDACIGLYTMAMQYNNTNSYSNSGYVPPEESLGGTPLNETILAAFTIVENIQKKTKSQIVTVAVITDGEGTYIRSKVNSVPGYDNDDILRDPVTMMEWKMDYNNQTAILIEALRYRLNVNAVGFYICSGNASTVKNTAVDMMKRYNPGSKKVSEDEIKRDFENNHFYSIKGAGYEEYFVIAGGKDISTSSNAVTSTGDLTADFINKAKFKSKRRIVLGRFVDIMAKKSIMQK